MRKLVFAVLATVFVCACTGDLKDRVDALEERVTALEEKVNGNVSSISALVAAAENAVTVSSVVAESDGYTINFSNGTTAKLTNGKDGANGSDGKDGANGKDGADGKDAVAPVIGVKEDSGVYYWTVDGEFLLNNGEKVPVTGKDGVDGKTPQFKIQDGAWYVSFDGTTWESVAVSGAVEPTLKMEETDEAYVFTLGDTKITIAKENTFAIKVDNCEHEVLTGDVVTLKYTLTGADETTHVLAEAQGVEYKLDEEACTVTVTVPDSFDGAYVLVKAVRNSDGKYSAQYITFKNPDAYGIYGDIIISDGLEYNW